jgi:hypothetical protein
MDQPTDPVAGCDSPQHASLRQMGMDHVIPSVPNEGAQFANRDEVPDGIHGPDEVPNAMDNDSGGDFVRLEIWTHGQFDIETRTALPFHEVRDVPFGTAEQKPRGYVEDASTPIVA